MSCATENFAGCRNLNVTMDKNYGKYCSYQLPEVSAEVSKQLTNTYQREARD